MPTIDDLHSAFDELEAGAPTMLPDRRRRSSRVPMVAATALVVAVAAVAVAVGMRHAHLDDRPVAQPSPVAPQSSVAPQPSTTPAPIGPGPRPPADLQHFHFGVDRLPGVTTVYTAADDAHEGAQLLLKAHDRSPVGWINVYRAGVSTPTRPAGATNVIVNGHRGFTGYLTANLPGMVAASDGPGLPAVAWQYEPGVWAVVQQGYAPTDARAPTALQIARAVRFGDEQQHPVIVPARFGYLPGGFELSGVDVVPQDGFFTTTVEFAATGGRVPMSISVSSVGTGETGPTPSGGRGVAVAFGLWKGRYDKACGSMWVTERGIDVAISTEDTLGVTCRGAAVLTQAELQEIVRRLAVADAPNDPADWYSVDLALP